MALTKSNIAEKIQAELDCTKDRSVEMVESLLESIKFTLESGENLLVSGFGKFCVREKAERKGRNPATGEDKILRARRVVTFRWSPKLRKKVNGK